MEGWRRVAAAVEEVLRAEPDEVAETVEEEVR
jgi:hypothetical protein